MPPTQLPDSLPPPDEDREVILLTKDGIWLADGSEITHEPTRKLFARSLKRDSNGYFLSIGRETKRISVEDTAFFIETFETESAPSGSDNQDTIVLQLSDGTREILIPETLKYSPGRLTAGVKSGNEEAKFLRAPYHQILREVEEINGRYVLRIGGKRIQLT
jgi:hypothetical protein